MKIQFDKKQLPKAVLDILNIPSSVYAKAIALTEWIEDSGKVDVNCLLCLANLEMACANAAGFEEDLIDFGTNAIQWLKQIPETSFENKEVSQYIQAIQKKIKKAERSVNEILAYEKENLDEMPGIFYVQELAFYYYARCKKGADFALKGYKAYKYVYEKELAENPDSPELLYYWHALTKCKLEAEGYEAAKEEIERLINWELSPQELAYREFITDAYWLKLFHFSELNDLDSFRNLYDEWAARMIPLEKSGNPYLANLDILNPVCNWLLQHENTDTQLKYILENGYLFFNKNVLEQVHKEVMNLIKKRLQIH